MCLRPNHSSSGKLQKRKNRKSEGGKKEIREANCEILSKSRKIFEPEHQKTGFTIKRSKSSLQNRLVLLYKMMGRNDRVWVEGVGGSGERMSFFFFFF